MLLILLLLVLNIYACNNKENNNQPVTKVNQHADSLAKGPYVSIENDTLVRIHFDAANTGDTAIANLFINGHQPIVCEVNMGKRDSIYAVLILSEKGGNIRFTQIVLPDKKKDGPFGKSISYNTPKPGTYQLIIGENKMAGDRWQGNFRIKVWLK